MARRPRVAFIDEAVHGHSTLMRIIAAAMPQDAPITPVFYRVPEPRGIERLAVARIPWLGDADMQPLRWRSRYSWRANRAIRAAAAEAVFVNSQSCAFLLPGSDAPPSVVSVDGTHHQLAPMEYWRERNLASPVMERLNERLERRAYEAAHTVLAWTEWAAGSLRNDYGIDPDRIVTMHVGVHAEKYAGIRRTDLVQATPLRLLFIGNQVDRKGLGVVAQALERLSFPAHLDVVTNDDVQGSSAMTIHRGLASGSPRFLELLSASDAFVFPTRADTVSWVVLEAMAAGLPVVTTRTGAIPELLGETGILVDRDPDSVAAAIDKLHADPEMGLRLGKLARERVKERYDASVQVPKLADLLSRAASGS